ncbi:hypothetical protein JCM12214_13020 [Geobacillus vulcani]
MIKSPEKLLTGMLLSVYMQKAGSYTACKIGTGLNGLRRHSGAEMPSGRTVLFVVDA